MKPRNLLFIMSDEHSKRVLGCHGHPMIRTPNLDRLAARGVRFTDAYCNSPICVPSRASFQTGRYVHDIRFWDNAIAYDGSVPSWAHRLKAAGHRVDSIGKLHFRSADDDNGFTKEHMPLHVVEGIGDPIGMLRDPPPPRKAALQARRRRRLRQLHLPGLRRPHHRGGRGLAARARRRARTSKPWVLFVSLVCPHFPLIARPEWYNLYPEDKVPWPRHVRRGRAADAPLRRRPCARARSTTRASTIRARCARRSPPTSASSASSTTTSAGWCKALRGQRPLRRHAHHLHQRPRRQPRHARAVGQVEHVRGVGRRADDHGRARGAAGRGLPRAGLAGRLLPHHRRLRRARAQSRRPRPAGRPAARRRARHGAASAPS